MPKGCSPTALTIPQKLATRSARLQAQKARSVGVATLLEPRLNLDLEISVHFPLCSRVALCSLFQKIHGKKVLERSVREGYTCLHACMPT
jgi:hypothetical protein